MSIRESEPIEKKLERGCKAMREADKARVETRMMNVPEVGHLNRSCILLNNPQQELIFRQLSHVANTQD